MKKIVLTAAVAIAAFAAKAQTTAVSTLNTSAILNEVIVLTPSSQNGAPGTNLPFVGFISNTFNTIAEYDNGLDLVENPQVLPGPGAGEFEFTIASSVGYNVVATSPVNFTWSGGGSQTYPMAASALKLTVVGAPSGATSVLPANTALNSAGTTLFAHPMGHTTANWGMNVHLTPGYGHQGGTYTLPVTITATTI